MWMFRFLPALIFLYAYFYAWQVFWSEQKLEDIQLFLQRPSYVILQDNDYVCDVERLECKLNIKFWFEKNTSLSSKILCEISSSFLAESIEKCNPNTLVIPDWEHNLLLKTYHKDSPEIIIEKHYSIINTPDDILDPKPEQSYSDEVAITPNDPEDNTQPVELKEPLSVYFDYVLQRPSYLIWFQDTYFCNREVCKLNLKLTQPEWEKDLSSKLSCQIDFWFVSSESEKCNPNTVDIPRWNHSITLKVFQKDDPANYSLREISVAHNYLDTETENSDVSDLPDPEIVEEKYLKWAIVIQSKDSSDRTISWDSVVCSWVERCNLNLDSVVETNNKLSDIVYHWDFWNGEFSSKPNPIWIWYSAWKYSIKLTLTDNSWNKVTDSISIEVSHSQTDNGRDENLETNLDISQYQWLKISGILVNPTWRDDDEWIEIINNSDHTRSLKWLIVDDIKWKWSKPYTIEKDIFLEPWETLKFNKSETNISLWNSLDEVNIYIWDVILDSYSWDFSVPENFVLLQDSFDLKIQEVLVSRVIDGDTFEVDLSQGLKRKVRLIWVDTPETKHPFQPLEKFGIQAYQYTQRQLEWKRVRLEYAWSTDSYNRLLWYVYVADNTTSFNQDLIQQWYARAYLKYPFTYSLEFEKAQDYAKKHRLWLWWNDEIKKQLTKIVAEEKKEVQVLQESLLNDDITIEELREDIHNDTLDNNFIPTIKNSVVTQIDTLDLKPNFSQSIAQQKRSLKIYGNTVPNIDIEILFLAKSYTIRSDDKWKYSLKLTYLQAWLYEINSKVIFENGYVYEVPRIKNLELTQQYIFDMNRANNTIAANKIQKNSPKKSSTIIQKDQVLNISKIQTELTEAVESSHINFKLLHSLLIAMIFLMLYLILWRWKII